MNEFAFKGLLQNNGWIGYVGAEYKPKIKTDDGIGWLELYRNSLNNMV